MNDVFEDFVVAALREALGLTEHAFPQNARGKSFHLDQASLVDLEPDISWWDRQVCVFVGDVKYKRVNPAGVKHPDLYQLLAYAVAAGLPGGLLIYAAGEAESARHDVINVGTELEVVTLDLQGPPPAILEQIARVARCTRHLRQRALAHRLTGQGGDEIAVTEDRASVAARH